jgi:hypothetical protein
LSGKLNLKERTRLSSSDKRVHFGLGDEKQISSIEIRWPRGAVQTLKDVAADRILKIEEEAPRAGLYPSRH